MAIRKNYPLTPQGIKRWANDVTKEMDKQTQAAARRNIKPVSLPQPRQPSARLGGFSSWPQGYPVSGDTIHHTVYGHTTVYGDGNQVAVGTAGDVRQTAASTGSSAPIDREVLTELLERAVAHLPDYGPSLTTVDRITVHDTAHGALQAAASTEVGDDELRHRVGRLRAVLGQISTTAAGGTIAQGIAQALAALLG